jgi:3-dehydro-L-gulonate-6-phosphate decarboxylase
MAGVPLLQCAMDYISLAPALAMTQRVAPEVDIIEIGTPLCKAEGLLAIRAVRELVPDKLILADFKSPDVGGLEAKMAFDAGADMMTVIGGAPLATVQQALDMARKMGKEMLMELTGVRDILARAKEWRQMGVERMVYHRGWDEQTSNRQWSEDDKAVIRQLIDMGFKITVTGGFTKQLLPFFADLAVSVVICGRGIREAPDPRAAAAEFRATMQSLWGGGGRAVGPAYDGGRVAAMGASERAARAIRYGVSEMGLLLNVDGRDCPGCDAPGRFCMGTAANVQAPAGVNAGTVIERMNQLFGRSQAFGKVSDTTFYLDPAQLPSPSADNVLELLRSTGRALQQLGAQVDLNSGVGIAERVLRG